MRVAIVLAALLVASAALAVPTLESGEAPWNQQVPDQEFSHPGNLLYEEECLVFGEEWDDFLMHYHYFQVLDLPFYQEPGNIYWISIQAVLVCPPQWGWCETDMYWNDEAVVVAPPLGVPQWTPYSYLLGYHVEMAFVLLNAQSAIKWAQYPMQGGFAYTSQFDPPAGAEIGSETADDFLCTDPDPIAAIEWWGGYWYPGEPPFVDYFIIRFYDNVPASPVEETSWGSIKAMFR